MNHIYGSKNKAGDSRLTHVAAPDDRHPTGHWYRLCRPVLQQTEVVGFLVCGSTAEEVRQCRHREPLVTQTGQRSVLC